MSENKQELLPCPFCGGEAHMLPGNDDLNALHYAWCLGCDAAGPTACFESDAIERWNSRAVLSASAGEKKVLEDLLPESLHTFLDVAGAEGLVFDGIDAGDLYKQLFPKRFEELAMSAPWRQQPQSASKSNQEQSTNKGKK